MSIKYEPASEPLNICLDIAPQLDLSPWLLKMAVVDWRGESHTPCLDRVLCLDIAPQLKLSLWILQMADID